jgi:hypothetical protein
MSMKETSATITVSSLVIRVRWLHPDRVIALPDAASHPVLGFRRTGEFTRLG